MTKKRRDRVCAAIIKNSDILMVYTEDGDHHFWTLPGGGVEQGETLEQAVVREVGEEVNLVVQVNRLLFSEPYTHGECYCFLTEVMNDVTDASLGIDPELDSDKQVLKRIDWKDIDTLKDDIQVSKVISALFSNIEEVRDFR